MTKRSWAVAVVSGVLLAGGVTGCSRSSTPAAGKLVVNGQAEVFRPGEERREVTGSRDLEIGDRVRVRQGTAVIRLPENRRLELRMGTDVDIQAGPGDDGVRPALSDGDLLVISGGRPLAVTATGGEVAVSGDARVSRGPALLVAVYAGTAQLTAGESGLAVPALRQAALPAAGPFPTRASPFEYSPADAWDQRYLSDTIELTNQLDARSRGFTGQLGATDGRSFNYFRDLFPRLAAEPGFTAALVKPGRLPGETLVGAAITLEGTRGAFAERWDAVFAFRDQGAPWGLVALDQGVRQAALLETIDGAIGRSPSQFAEGQAGTSPNSVAPPSHDGSPATTAAPRSTTTTTTRRPPGQATTTTTSTTVAPSTNPPGPLNTGSPLIDDTVNSLVDTLTGLLRSLGQQ